MVYFRLSCIVRCSVLMIAGFGIGFMYFFQSSAFTYVLGFDFVLEVLSCSILLMFLNFLNSWYLGLLIKAKLR